jgi:hypothetical protein
VQLDTRIADTVFRVPCNCKRLQTTQRCKVTIQTEHVFKYRKTSRCLTNPLRSEHRKHQDGHAKMVDCMPCIRLVRCPGWCQIVLHMSHGPAYICRITQLSETKLKKVVQPHTTSKKSAQKYSAKALPPTNCMHQKLHIARRQHHMRMTSYIRIHEAYIYPAYPAPWRKH